MKLTEVAASTWFRTLVPVFVLIAFELLIRYLGKSDRQRLKADDLFLALPLLSAAITALPGLIALRAGSHPSQSEITAGGFALVILVLTACWLVVFDRRTMRKLRRGSVRWKQIASIAVPDLLAALCLALVFAYAP